MIWLYTYPDIFLRRFTIDPAAFVTTWCGFYWLKIRSIPFGLPLGRVSILPTLYRLPKEIRDNLLDIVVVMLLLVCP